MRIASMFLAATMFTGCVIGDEANPGETDPEIIGGVTDSGDPAVGFLRSVVSFDLYGRPSGISICTATLIAPRVMLTAGHCAGSGLVDVSFSATPNLFGPMSTGEYMGASVLKNPAFRGDVFAGHDIAVVLLKQAVNVTPKRRGATPAIGSLVRAVGYGMSTFGHDGTGAGTKREVLMPVIDSSLHEIVAGTDGVGTCHGDSGGPIFAGDAIVGTTSYGDDADCHNSGHYTRIDDNLAFIHLYAPSF